MEERHVLNSNLRTEESDKLSDEVIRTAIGWDDQKCGLCSGLPLCDSVEICNTNKAQWPRDGSVGKCLPDLDPQNLHKNEWWHVLVIPHWGQTWVGPGDLLDSRFSLNGGHQ